MRNREHHQQVIYFDWVDRMAVLVPAMQRLVFAIPNAGGYTGGYSNNRLRVIAMKREGLRAGVADIFISIPARGYHGAYLELKIEPNKPTADQAAFLSDASVAGYFTKVCWSAEELIETTKYYLGEIISLARKNVHR